MFTYLFSNIGLGLSIAIPLGPINLEIIRTGIRNGFWPSFFVGAGGMSADFLIMIGMFQGIGHLLMIERVRYLLYVIVSFLLIYMGVVSITKKMDIRPSENVSASQKSSSVWPFYFIGMSLAAFNPLNVLFWLGIYGTVLSEALLAKHKWNAFWMSSSVFIGIGLWNLHLMLTVHYGQKLLHTRTLHGLSFTAGCILIVFGTYFGYRACLFIF